MIVSKLPLINKWFTSEDETKFPQIYSLRHLLLEFFHCHILQGKVNGVNKMQSVLALHFPMGQLYIRKEENSSREPPVHNLD